MYPSYEPNYSLPPIFWVIYLGIFLLMFISNWRLFVKANQPGCASLIPIYNTVVCLRIGGLPWYWLFLLFVPLVNIVISIIMLKAFLEAYGKGSIGSVLLALFFGIIYIPYLAFSNDVQYVRNTENNNF